MSWFYNFFKGKLPRSIMYLPKIFSFWIRTTFFFVTCYYLPQCTYSVVTYAHTVSFVNEVQQPPFLLVVLDMGWHLKAVQAVTNVVRISRHDVDIWMQFAGNKMLQRVFSHMRINRLWDGKSYIHMELYTISLFFLCIAQTFTAWLLTIKDQVQF
jgi:hypothetical protein